jgi:aryl carrier-like protein
MTENAHQITTNVPDQAKPGYVGKPSGSVSLRIFGDDPAAGPLATDVQGEICITGASVMRGYLDNPEANAKAFFTGPGGIRWLRTGDIGVLDSQAAGYLCIVGRKSEIINRGGEKISPPEVDEAMILCAAPHVREAACFAVPDAFFGQEVEAALVLAKDAPQELHDEATIQRLLEERLALFKIPKRIHFFEDKIPKGPTGKIQRVQLSRTLAKQADGEVNANVVNIDPANLPARISELIAQAFRVDAGKVQPKVMLLELGADSMSLTRLLGDLRHVGCSIAMSDLMLNPTVQQVIDMCMKSHAAGKGTNKTRNLGTDVAEDVEPPARFSLLSELIEGIEDALSLDSVLAHVTKQTGLQVDELEDVLPLSPEAKWFQSQTLTTKWGLEGTAASFVTMGAPINDSVDIEKLKWAFAEAAKAEPVRHNTVPPKHFCRITAAY